MPAQKTTFQKQVEEVLETFDFERVHRVMESLAWTWANLDRVPTQAELAAEARRLLAELDGRPGVPGQRRASRQLQGRRDAQPEVHPLRKLVGSRRGPAASALTF